MKNLAAGNKGSVQRAAIRGEATEMYGMDWYALPMEKYEMWQSCKSVLTARQSTFPAAFIAMPYLEAVFAMELECIRETGEALGVMRRMLELIACALREDPQEAIDEKKTIRILIHGEKLDGIGIEKDGNCVAVTPAMYDGIRKLILWQQGEDVPDESLNDELLEAERDIASRNAPRLKYSMTDMLASVAAAMGMRMRDMDGMTILEFDTMRRAIDRAKHFDLCAQGAAMGAKWENGNPFPSWMFDRDEGRSGALVSFDRFRNDKKE